MRRQLECYLRPYRRRWGLTQTELAVLLGFKSGTFVSRLERQERQPSLQVAFACQIIFGVPPDELFPSIMVDVEDGVTARAYDMYDDLQGSRSVAVRGKLDLFEELFARARARANEKSS